MGFVIIFAGIVGLGFLTWALIDAFSIELDPTARPGKHPGDDVEKGGLPSSVGADDRLDLALLHREGEVEKSHQPAKSLPQFLRLQDDVAHWVTAPFRRLTARDSSNPVRPLGKNIVIDRRIAP